MPQYTLAEAAKATGKSKSTILRSIKAGRISAVRDELSGGWLVEPAEPHRLYAEHDAVRGAANGEARNGHRNGHDAAAEVEIRELRARLADKDAVIADLGRRLDAESEERRRLTAVLADQRRVANGHSTADSPAPARRRRWWPWRR